MFLGGYLSLPTSPDPLAPVRFYHKTRPHMFRIIALLATISFVLLLILFNTKHQKHAIFVNTKDPRKIWSSAREMSRLRQGILSAKPLDYIAERRQNDSVPLYNSQIFDWPDVFLPRNEIRTWPRQIDLPPMAPNLEELLFIYTTTSSRAASYSTIWKHFLRPHNGPIQAPCLIVVHRSEEPNIEDLRKKLAENNLSCTIQCSDIQRYETRILNNLEVSWQLDQTNSLQAGKHDIKWFIVNDDDTIWLDTRLLQRKLAPYSYEDPHFFGTYTEPVGQLKAFGLQAFGGGGMILSRKVIKRLNTNGLLAECIEDTKNSGEVNGFDNGWRLKTDTSVWRMGGDSMVTYAASRGKDVPYREAVEELEGLHQMDLPGEASGFLQSGLFFMSVHHLIGSDGWAQLVPKDPQRPGWPLVNDWLSMSIFLKAVAFLGGDNFLQRYSFDSGRVLLVNGYTVTVYTYPLTPDDLSKIEYTWWWNNYNTKYPQRRRIYESPDESRAHVDQRKTTFFIRDVLVSKRDSSKCSFLYETTNGHRIIVHWEENGPYLSKLSDYSNDSHY